ncbi:MAG: DegV family protein [Chloroflexota bacterium]|nr:DegV family protein [Chloroflexota bacterium]
MKDVAVLTDSISCLTKEQVVQYEISVVPAANICFQGKIYKEWVDLTTSQAYEMLERDPDHFGSSAVSSMDFYEVFKELSVEAQSIVCITLAKKLSAVHNMARIAMEQMREECPETTIALVDSESATAAEGLIVLAAARAAMEGKGLEYTMEETEAVKAKVRLAALMKTMRYAYRTGRIPKLAARMGSTFNIRPVFTISKGTVRTITIVRSQRKGEDQLMKLIRDTADNGPVHVAVMHAAVPQEGERLMDRISSNFDCAELWLTEFSPTMAYSAGPGILGVACYKD